MEHSMRLVEQHCAKYLSMFGECVHQFPHTWQMDCEPQRRKLARCAETNPEILHIKSVCAKQFSDYEKCMKENKSNPDECSIPFDIFSSCAQDALSTYSGNGIPTLTSGGKGTSQALPIAVSNGLKLKVDETVRQSTPTNNNNNQSVLEERVASPSTSGSVGYKSPDSGNKTTSPNVVTETSNSPPPAKDAAAHSSEAPS